MSSSLLAVSSKIYIRTNFSIAISVRADTRRPKGFGFIEFDDPEDAKEAIYRMDRTEFGGRMLEVCRAKEGRKRPEDMKMKSSHHESRGRDRHYKRSRSRSRDRRRRHSRSRSRSRSRRYSPTRSRSRSRSRSLNEGRRSPSASLSPEKDTREEGPQRYHDRPEEDRDDRSHHDADVGEDVAPTRSFGGRGSDDDDGDGRDN